MFYQPLKIRTDISQQSFPFISDNYTAQDGTLMPL
jgi:hypothetical protein